MTNAEVRTAMQAAGLRYWMLAEALGIHPSTLSVKLRHELPDSDKKKLLQLVEQLKPKKEA